MASNKTRIAWTAAMVLSLAGCSKTPEAAPATDEVAQDEIRDLKQQLRKLEQFVNAPNTTGLETADLGRRLMQYEARIKALEEKAGTPATTGGAAPSADPSTAGSQPAPLAGVVPSGTTNYTEEQIADFRRLLDVAEKRKQDEQQTERLKTQLTRIGVELTPDQEKAVVNLTLAWQQKARDVWRGGFGQTDADRQAITDKVNALRTQYESDLKNVLPLAVADKVIEGMGRGMPGFYGTPRRVDGTTGRGGMNGN